MYSVENVDTVQEQMCFNIYMEAQQFTQQTQPNDLKQDLFIEQGEQLNLI